MSGQHFSLSSLAVALMVTIVFIQEDHTITAIPQPYRGENDTFGVISSTQSDDSGKPAWIVVGNWKTSLLNDVPFNASPVTANTTLPFASSPFNTQLKMVRLDGTLQK